MCKYFWKGEKDEIYAAEKSIRGHLNYHAYLLKSLIQKHKKDITQFKFILIERINYSSFKRKHNLLNNIILSKLWEVAWCIMSVVSAHRYGNAIKRHTVCIIQEGRKEENNITILLFLGSWIELAAVHCPGPCVFCCFSTITTSPTLTTLPPPFSSYALAAPRVTMTTVEV